MFIYHYNATKQFRIGELVNIDGIAVMGQPILSMDDYSQLKSAIAKTVGIEDASGFTICSLTLLQDGSKQSEKL